MFLYVLLIQKVKMTEIEEERDEYRQSQQQKENISNELNVFEFKYLKNLRMNHTS